MFDYLEKLRQKPERSKKIIAFTASLFCAGTIFLVWMTVVFPDIRQDKEVKDKIASIEPSPFSSFFENLSKGFSGVKDQFSNMKDKLSELSATVINANSTVKEATTTVESTDTLILTDESETATSTTSTTSITKIME